MISVNHGELAPTLEVLRAYSSDELFESLRPAAERAPSEWRG